MNSFEVFFSDDLEISQIELEFNFIRWENVTSSKGHLDLNKIVYFGHIYE